MSERVNPVVLAIEVVMQIERGWKPLPKRVYRHAKATIAEALQAAYARGVGEGRRQAEEERATHETPTAG